MFDSTIHPVGGIAVAAVATSTVAALGVGVASVIGAAVVRSPLVGARSAAQRVRLGHQRHQVKRLDVHHFFTNVTVFALRFYNETLR